MPRSWKKATAGKPEALHGAVQKLLTEIIKECEADHFQRRRLLGRMAPGSREARPAEHEDGRRCLADARRPGSAKLVRQVQRAFGARTQEPVAIFTSSNTARRFAWKRMQTLEMAKTMIFPAAIRYQNELASTCANLKLRRLRVRYRHARQDDRAGEVPARQHRRARQGARPARRGEPAGRSQALLRRSGARAWPAFANMPTSWKAGSPTTCGRCRLTRKCCLLSKPETFGC